MVVMAAAIVLVVVVVRLLEWDEAIIGTGVEVLADANVNVFASLMIDLEFNFSTPSGGFSR